MTKPRLLLVEDDPNLISIYRKFLETAGFMVTATKNTSEALRFIEDSDALDLAIIDFWLDKSNASDVLDRLRERFPDTPMLVISGGNDTKPIEIAHAAAQVSGALAFLQKPFDRDNLISIATRLTTRG